jgi:hydrogenase maturation protein HypF
MTTVLSGLKVKVRGTVQGVGFRPFIYHLAVSLGLTGWVKNTSAGVEIEVDGPPSDLSLFEQRIRAELPPLATIDTLSSSPCPPAGFLTFEILASQSAPGDFQPVPPDIAICPDCRKELFDPQDRRYRYPFINCTNCGPRFSIIRDIPYDRPLTSMSGFQLCQNCSGEYQDPLDRRFHAQPVACPVCGPHIWYEVAGQIQGEHETALQMARTALTQGQILAVKGLGGFHLACDASNPQAVAELRRRKKRSDKPFALMAFDLATLERHCQVSPQERDLLLSRQAPIVLLERLPGSSIASAQVAPAQNVLGVMLAYTPLHLLLCETVPGFPEVLVMTSGNLSEEPIAYQDGDALERLTPLADAFLLHDRPIHIWVDDSVLVHPLGQPYFVRRSRGYAPEPVHLAQDLPPIFAAGAELKNTFCLTRENYAFLSHHIGDLENYETLQSYEEGVRHYERLFRVKPQILACDLHPDYLSTRYAETRSQQENLPLIPVQHHHAHLAACLADNGWEGDAPAIGLSFDGTGLGSDGAIWGGEVLLGGYRTFERRFHLAYAPLPGGDMAVRKPARMALAYLRQAGLDWEADLPPVEHLCAEERTVIASQIQHHLNSPSTSSMGRFFDAVSALIGIRQTATYEGQAAIELEAAADPAETGLYPFIISEGVFNPAPLLQEIITDWRAHLPVSVLAARFHNSIAQLALDLCLQIRAESGARSVALSGGVWQNRLLLTKSAGLLRDAGFNVLIHRHIPANDGGIAVGQALIAAHRLYP